MKINHLMNQDKMTQDNRLSIKDYFDRIVDDAFQDLFVMPFTGYQTNFGISKQILEDGKAAITLDLAGVNEEDIAVEIDDNVVNVKAERKLHNSISKISRSFTIPSGFTSNNVVADLKNGVLSFTFEPEPKKEIKKIPINSK